VRAFLHKNTFLLLPVKKFSPEGIKLLLSQKMILPDTSKLFFQAKPCLQPDLKKSLSVILLMQIGTKMQL